MIVTLLPYSFLSYMSRVPSRHTYFETVGLSMILACALFGRLETQLQPPTQMRSGCVCGCNSYLDIAYIWTKKHYQLDFAPSPLSSLYP